MYVMAIVWIDDTSLYDTTRMLDQWAYNSGNCLVGSLTILGCDQS